MVLLILGADLVIVPPYSKLNPFYRLEVHILLNGNRSSPGDPEGQKASNENIMSA